MEGNDYFWSFTRSSSAPPRLPLHPSLSRSPSPSPSPCPLPYLSLIFHSTLPLPLPLSLTRPPHLGHCGTVRKSCPAFEGSSPPWRCSPARSSHHPTLRSGLHGKIRYEIISIYSSSDSDSDSNSDCGSDSDRPCAILNVISHHTALHCVIPLCTVLYGIVLHLIVLHCTALQCIKRYYTIMYCTVRDTIYDKILYCTAYDYTAHTPYVPEQLV